MKNKNTFNVLLCGVLLGSQVYGNVFTAVSTSSGNWNNSASWSLTSGTSSLNYPTPGDTVYLPAGKSITIPSSFTAYAALLTLDNNDNSASVTLTFASSSSALIVSGNVNMNTYSTQGSFSGTINGIINMTGGNFSIGGNLVCIAEKTGSYSMDQTITLGGGTLTIAGNATFTHNGGGNAKLDMTTSGSTFNVAGNLTLDVLSNNSGATGNVLFNGTSTQSINGTSPVFSTLTINNTGGSVNLNVPVSISTGLTLTSGNIISTSTNFLTINNGATSSSGSFSSFINGPVLKIGNSAFTFPTGNLTDYQPISISAPAHITDGFTAQYFKTNQSLGNTLDTGIANLSNCEYWTLNQTTGTDNVSVTLGWNSNSCNVTQNDSNMRIALFNSTTNKWTDEGGINPTGNSSYGTITSAFALASYGSLTYANKYLTPGISCSNAIQLPGNDTLMNATQTDSVIWYSFVPIFSNSKIVVINKSNSTVGRISRLTLYSGGCNNLQQIGKAFLATDTTAIKLYGDSVILYVNNLVQGQTYNLSLKKELNNSNPVIFNVEAGQNSFLSVNGCANGFGNICGNIGPFFNYNPALGFTENNPFGFYYYVLDKTSGPNGASDIQNFQIFSTDYNFVNNGLFYTVADNYQNNGMGAGNYTTNGNYQFQTGSTTTNGTAVIILNGPTYLHYSGIIPSGTAPGTKWCYTLYLYQLSFSGPAQLICDGSLCITTSYIEPLNSSAISGCLGQCETLSAPAGSNYTWETGSSSIVGTTENINVCPTTTTTYTLNFLPDNPCIINNEAVTVNVNPTPIVTITGNTNICSGSSTTLAANVVSQLSFTYQWSNGANTSSINVSPLNNTTYTVTITNTAGCSSTASVSVTVGIVTISATVASGSPILCSGDATLQATGNSVSYLWEPGNLSGSTVTVSPTEPTTYTVTGTDANGCNASTTVFVQYYGCCTSNTGYTNTTFSTNTTISSNSSFSGIITVASGVVLTINGGATIFMGTNAQINLLAGASMVITGASILLPCANMWQGIYLTTATSTITVNEGSTIEGAQNAIVSNFGAKFTVNGAIFNENYIGVLVNTYTTANHPGTIINAQFTCTSGLFPPYPPGRRSYTGIYIDQVGNYSPSISSITIGTATVGNQNVFDNQDYGIQSIQSYVTARNCTFQNMSGASYYTCAPSVCVPPPAIGVGIRMDNSVSDATFGNGRTTDFRGAEGYLHVFDCIFQNVYRGIDINYGSNLTITNNIFDNSTSGSTYAPYGNEGINAIWFVIPYYNSRIPSQATMQLNTINNNGVGILTNIILPNQDAGNNGTLAINNNQINTINYTPNVSTVDGIVAEQSLGYNFLPITSVSINENSINNCVQRGILASSIYTGYAFLDLNQIGFVPSGNFLKQGINVQAILTYAGGSNNGSVDVGNNTITSSTVTSHSNIHAIDYSQTIYGSVHNNILNNTGIGMNFSGTCGFTSVTCNQMNTTNTGINFAKGTSMPATNGTSILPQDNQWINVPSSGPSSGYFVGALTPEPTWYVRPTGNYNFTGTNEYPSGLVAIPVPTSTSASSNCTPSCVEPPCLQLQLINLLQNNSFGASTQNTFANDEFVYSQLLFNDTLMNMGTSYDSALTHFYDSISSTTIGQISQVEHLIASGNLSGALSLNGSISTPNIVVSNIISLDSIYINTIATNFNRNSTSQERSILFNIAQQCPLAGGRAVYQARALLSVLKDSVVTYNDDSLCANSNSGRMRGIENSNNNKTNNTSNPTFKLYPNPNNGDMTLEYNIAGSKAQFVLYDITGKLVNSYDLNVKGNLFQVAQSNLRNGVYYYEIQVDGQVVKYDKIVIIN